jgi:hypothetical protein
MPIKGPFATIEEITLLGVGSAEAWCRACSHRAELPLGRFLPTMHFVSIQPRDRRNAIEISPDWRDYWPGGRM